MWASNLHLPLCLSKRGTRPEFVNRKGETSKLGGGGVRRGGKKTTDKAGGAATADPHESPAGSLPCLS